MSCYGELTDILLAVRWNMMSKPTAPQSEVRHERGITGLHSTGERSFASCSLDGRLCVWDLSQGKRPVSTLFSPDGRSEIILSRPVVAQRCPVPTSCWEHCSAQIWVACLCRPILKMAVRNDGLVAFCTQTGPFLLLNHVHVALLVQLSHALHKMLSL